MTTKAEQQAQAELRERDRSGQVAVEPDHEPVPTIGRQKPIQHVLAEVSLAVGFVKKEGKLTDGARYEYRGIEHVLNKVGPAFAEHGIVATPKLLRWTRDQYTTKNGSLQHWYVVEVEYTFTGPAGDTLIAITPGEGADSADKALSKAMAVAFRTVLVQVLALPTKDEDGESTRAEAAPAPDMRTINLARQHLDEALQATTVEQVGAIWETASADGSITVAVDHFAANLSSKPLSEHLKGIGTQLQAQVTP